jgi:hypothetical protein
MTPAEPTDPIKALRERRRSLLNQMHLAKAMRRQAENLERQAAEGLRELDVAFKVIEEVMHTTCQHQTDLVTMHASNRNRHLHGTVTLDGKHARFYGGGDITHVFECKNLGATDHLKISESEFQRFFDFDAVAKLATETAKEHASVVEHGNLKDQVLMVCEHVLLDGSTKPTEELHAMCVEMGVKFSAQNPAQRISQILSADSRFKATRGKGWSLTRLTSPDEWDAKLRTEARRVVNNER